MTYLCIVILLKKPNNQRKERSKKLVTETDNQSKLKTNASFFFF